ncbi:MAG: DUF262 domain-containing protein [Planctomycetes bacterium]|nr:DUF262 domain-containing protein [Planctomycetota bacterium]
MAKVNLDALIPREDFEVKEPTHGMVARSMISINDLKEKDFFFSALRKPDFQRETNEWDTNKICDFIQSYLEGDLIPAVILWRSASGFIFVIDGSHRLSALSAWINNDYGDGDISKKFYDGIIPDEQIEIAERMRNQIRKRVGLFKDYELATSYPDKVKPEIVERAKSLGALAIQLQWVQGDSSKAEASYFKINQQASPINPTELRVLQARKQPNAIAARAIIRSGKGHKYWSAFSEENQLSIEEIAKEINKLLFNPELDSPIKTLDLPIGGKAYAAQSLPLVLDFINIVNNVSDGLHPDQDGKETIQFLTRCKNVAQRINSNHPGSLGLHPIIYFYAPNGRHKPASFFALTALILDFEKLKYFDKFTKARDKFESLLLKYDYLIQQIVRKHRSATASYPYIKDFYLRSIEKLLDEKNIDQAVNQVIKDVKFNYLTQAVEEADITGQDFSKETKSAAFIRDAIKTALRCSICGGYIHKNAISIDHIVRKEEGGTGSLDNAQLAHPYCNTTFKN